MKHRAFTLWLVWLLCMLPPATQTKAAGSKEAGRRAALFQAKMHAVLSDNHWRIVRDQPGKLIAEHAMGLAGPLNPAIAAVVRQEFPSTGRWLFKFEPATEHRTNCTASGEMYTRQHQANSARVSKTVFGPYPVKDEESIRAVKSLLAQAEKRLAKTHPEYAAQ